MVPIRLDATQLEADRFVVEAMADFSRLPYSDGGRDVNPDIANLSEEILSQPFNNQNLLLKAGIHLHWALPDALTQGTHSTDGTDFPAVPNRWLVIRSSLSENGSTADKSWVVESDYLYPDGTQSSAGVSYPFAADPTNGKFQPFRHLGRRMPIDAWTANDASAEYLDTLTAVGYGEPAFAAFYPNCHSVFGFFDEDYAAGIPDGLQYDVIGWYADSAQDFLSNFLRELASENSAALNAELVTSLEEELKWTVEISDQTDFPERMLCYARVTFKPSADSIENPVVNDPNVIITVGNTGTEALSAYLAQNVDSDQKATIEDQLESLQLSSSLENHQIDVGPKFTEARHEKGFTSLVSSSAWTIKLDTDDSAAADAASAQAQAQITLTDELAAALNEVNRLQTDYDAAIDEIESMRKQLFSDWYKYMLCAYPPEDSRDDYPDIDEVRHYIEVKDIGPLKDRLATVGTLLIVQGEAGLVTEADESGTITAAKTSQSAADSLAAQTAQAINDLLNAVAEFNKTANADGTQPSYQLKLTPGQRYWQPSEPVALMTGPAVRPTLRHGQDSSANEDGLLQCQIYADATVDALIPDQINAIVARLDETGKDTEADLFGFNTWEQQPWNVFLLEWEVEVFPILSRSNLDSETGDYFTDFITSNFTLKENQPDLSVQDGKGEITSAANIYNGSSILTPYASSLLTEQLENYLTQTAEYLEAEIPLTEYYEAHNIPESERTESYFSEHTDEILNWYLDTYCQDASSSLCSTIPVYQNMSRAYELLNAPDFYSLSQALGGFNDALIQHKQTLQLAIADPLGFDDYQSFAEATSDGVGDFIKSAPEPLTDFNPIRSGAMKIQRLRLVDTFGQIKDLDCSNILTTEGLAERSSAYLISMPPRLVQPARLNFRWLSAAEGAAEMNDQLSSSPICGWVLANNLDNSLMIYDAQGAGLGLIDQAGNWEPFPGDDTPVAVNEIENPYLKKMVNDYLLGVVRSEGSSFISSFISALDSAMDNIEPENFAQHQELAILTGRPLALVRASVGLELQGQATIDQSWDAFRQDMQRNTRETRGFAHVEFPLRLGEYKQLNDGLVGYWREAATDGTANIFYSPQADSYDTAHIETHADDPTRADDPMTLYQALDAPPQVVSMLIDPRAVVHATCGILPTKAINLPADQYTSALQAIAVTFLSTPILSEAGKLRLPLPAEAGYKWSWLQKVNGAWLEISSTGIVTQQLFLDAFPKETPDEGEASEEPKPPDGEAVWAELLKKQWIVSLSLNAAEADAPGTKASVTPKDQRPQPSDLDEKFTLLVPQIEDLLEKSYIGKIDTGASFANQQEIREGWLKLSST